MATATKKQRPKQSPRPSMKKAPGKKARSSKKGATVKSAGPGKFATGQPPLAGMEDIDERVPALDEVCQRAISDKAAKELAAQDFVEDLEKIGELLDAHNLDCYIVAGKKFFIEPGEAHVKMQKVKQ